MDITSLFCSDHCYVTQNFYWSFHCSLYLFPFLIPSKVQRVFSSECSQIDVAVYPAYHPTDTVGPFSPGSEAAGVLR